MEVIKTFYTDYILLISLITPLLIAAIVLIFAKLPTTRNLVCVILACFQCINILYLIKFCHIYTDITYNLTTLISGLSISFRMEPFGLIFSLVASFLWLVTIIYSIGYLQMQNTKENILLNKDLNATTFFFFKSLAMSCTFAIAFAANLFTIFIFYELLTLATYPLIAERHSSHAQRSAKKYLLVLMITSVVFLLPAIVIINNIVGTLDFQVGGILAGKFNKIGITILLICFIFGTSKIAIMPFHQWLPAAMVAPVPVSALLHAVAVVKSGVYIIIKVIIYIFGLDNLASISGHFPWLNNWIIIISCITIILSSIIACYQQSLKKILAYSTIGQLSYCILAASILTPKALIAAVLHMIAHAFSKITLFFAAGSIFVATHKTDIQEINGLGKLMPYTCFAFTVCSLSLIGIPPLAGFFSKFYILGAAIDSNYTMLVIVTISISTLLNAYYFIPIIYRLYWNTLDTSTIIYKSPPMSIIFSMMVTTASSVCLVWFFPYIIEFLKKIHF